MDIIALLQQMGAEVLYVDPYVLSIRADGIEMKRKENVKEALKLADCAVIVTNHTAFDWEMIASESKIIVDTRDVVRHVR